VSLFDAIRRKAKESPKRIILPEGEDDRIIEAAKTILERGYAKLILVGRESARARIGSAVAADLEMLDPAKYAGSEALGEAYYRLRKHKGVSLTEAKDAVKNNPVLFAIMQVREGYADGVVAGASHTTPNVLRFALHCLPRDESAGTISGAFLMELPDPAVGEDGVLLFADCAVNPEPNARQLCGITQSSAKTFLQLVGKTPKIALLSYSSKGSARGLSVQRMQEALQKTQEKYPDLIVDGELQLDSAIVPDVARRKCPKSKVAGRANVLIFPNLDAGNISYKLVQRLARARAVGPIIQGFKKACSDLSRGCDVEDIIDAVAVTAVRAETV